MTNIFHPAPERGHVDFGWLDSHHSFSFGNWYDREKVHFGALRVLNDDVVKGGNGFDAQSHENMEIISIPLKGTLADRESGGSGSILSAGDVRIISAGSGIRLSDYNASHFDPVNFLQIWIFPKQLNIRPRHEKRSFDPAARLNRWQVVVSALAGDGGLYIYQDARLALTRLEGGRDLEYEVAFEGNGVYVFVVNGLAAIGDRMLAERDGMGITGTDRFTVHAECDSELLAIEVPMFG